MPQVGPSVTGYEDKFRNFVKEHIKQRECVKYIQEGEGRTNCKCGRTIDWHQHINIDECTPDREWENNGCTKQETSDSFGEIAFCGFGHKATIPVPYLRVDYETDPKNAWELLSDCWNVPPPNLVISVTGGGKQFFMKRRLLNIFKHGLIHAATTTGAWIITGGTNTGVMKIVGEAVREHALSTGTADNDKIVALGVTTWGIVDNRKELIGQKPGAGRFPAKYHFEDLSPERKSTAAIDYNHSHFIFVDDGTEGKYGVEIPFRGKLEHFISTQKLNTESDVNIPVVLIVAEGGIGTLRQAAESITNNMPIVVIQGTGRAADYIAMAYKEKGREDEDFDKVQTEKAARLFGATIDTATCVQCLKRCLSNTILITVFSLNDEDGSTVNDIDHAILHALLKANVDAQTQLTLSLAWNRCDIARREIFKEDNLSNWKKLELADGMFTALIQNHVDFVKLFLDNGVELQKFLTVKRLYALYDKVIDQSAESSTELLRSLHETEKQRGETCRCRKERESENVLYIIGQVLKRLLGDQYPNVYNDERFLVAEENEREQARVPMNEQDNSIECPERELLMWAILLNRFELAKLFWKNGKDHIGGALTASALFKALATHETTEKILDLSSDLENNSRAFEQLAVGVLGECFMKDKYKCHTLLVRELEHWGNKTVLSIAESAELMEFMVHSACQTKLNTVWKGNMALYTSYWKIGFMMFFPMLVPLIKFTRNSDSDTSILEVKGNHNDVLNTTKLASQKYMQNGSDFNNNGDRSSRLRNVKRGKRHLYSVNGTEREGNKISLWRALLYYYVAPVTKFMYNLLSSIVFLVLFSYFLLVELCPVDSTGMTCEAGPSVAEYVTWCWCATLIFEEIRQIYVRDPHSAWYKIKDWFSNVWNAFDLILYILFVSSCILRLTLKGHEFMWARISYSCTLSLFFLRFMHMFFVAKNIGPKVIMIRKMLTDLMFFFVILVVFIMSYGVAQQALLFPNSTPSWTLLVDVVYQPYWRIYGELFLDTVEGKGEYCSTNSTESGETRCPEDVWIVPIMLAGYMILTNVLLLNLLIAMFSYTFQKVQDNSEKVWRFYRYSLIHEYLDRPALAPPLIIFNLIYRIFNHFVNRCRKNVDTSTLLCTNLSPEEGNRLTAFEREGMNKYLINTKKKTRENIDSRVASAGERIEKLIEDLEEIKEQLKAKKKPDNVQ